MTDLAIKVHRVNNGAWTGLRKAGPADLDQASRVPGITPAALSALHFALMRSAA